MRARGAIVQGLAIFVAVIAFATLVGCLMVARGAELPPALVIEPPHQRLPETSMAPNRRRHRDRDDEGCSKQSCNRHQHNGDNKAGPIYICIQPGSCQPPKDGQGPKYASLFPPTPQKIIAMIQTIFTDTQTFVFGILKLVA